MSLSSFLWGIAGGLCALFGVETVAGWVRVRRFNRELRDSALPKKKPGQDGLGYLNDLSDAQFDLLVHQVKEAKRERIREEKEEHG